METVGLMSRILLPASHRPWTIVGNDYYQHTPYMAIRDTNCCLSPVDRPTVQVYYQDKYVGKIVETTIFNCCCLVENYQELEIYNESHEMIYKITSKNPQPGHFIVLPCWGFDEIVYLIEKCRHRHESTSLGLGMEDEVDRFN